jgi:hypothetical protein
MAASKPPPKITEVAQDEEVDPHLVEVDSYDPGGVETDDISFDDLERSEELTTTESFHRHHNLQGTETVDQIVDLGVEVLDPDALTHIVRVHSDIGPVYYGGPERVIELKKNRRYRVPADIYRYLRERGLLVDQLAENPIY